MARSDRTSTLRYLQSVTMFSLAGAVVMLIIAAVMRSFGHVRTQILLTFVCLLLGALLMQVQLWARRRLGGGGISTLLSLGVLVILVSQASFLCLVWTSWKAWSLVWRIWWVSMVPSVFVTHLLLIHAASRWRGGLLERVTGLFVVWAGLMILWLGLREDMLSGVSPTYLAVGAVPAAGTVICSLWLVLRWMLGATRPGDLGKGAALVGVLMSHLVVAVAAFYLGRFGAGRGREFRENPHSVIARAGEEIRDLVDKDRYLVQSRFAEYLGDTRIIGREPFISLEQIETIRPRLRPGDIILERRNWYLSNPFLPGFWPHAALYVGDLKQLMKLGIADYPTVRKALAGSAEQDEQPTIIEAVSEGVILNTLSHSLHADYVAVLRPRLNEQQRAAAIVRAFQNLGKPYDFNFDFDDRTKLVCTQVVYVSYQGTLNFPLKRIMGRNTLPAVEIARKYVTERDQDGRQFDLVVFLDGVASSGTAREATEADFCASVDRPRALVER